MKTESGRKSGDEEKIKLANEEESRKDEDKDAARKGKGQDEDKGKAEENKEPEIDQEKVDAALEPLRQTVQEAAAASSKTKSPKSKQDYETSADENVEVLKTEDKYYVAGVRSLDKASLKKLFTDKGIDKDIEFPGDWNRRTSESKIKYLREQGVEVIPAMAGEEDELKWLEKLPDKNKVSGELGNYISEIERVAKDDRIIPSEKLDALANIDKNLTDAILKGDIKDENVDSVRDVISEGRSSLVGQAKLRESSASAMGWRGPEFQHDSEFEIPTKQAADKLIELAREGRTSGNEWDSNLKVLNERIAEVKALADATVPKNFKKAYFITKGIRDAVDVNRSDFEKLPDDIQHNLESIEIHLENLDRKFQGILNELSTREQHTLVGDIDSEAGIYYKQVIAGYGETIGSAKYKLLQKFEGEDPRGIREWRAVKSVESLEEAIRVEQLTEPSVIWQEIPDKLASVFTQMEGMNFSVEELQVVTNQAIQLVRQVTPDDPRGRALRDKLVDELDAFRAFHSWRITMERNDMNPEQMLQVFQTYFKDDTWKHFAERFSKDVKSRPFVVLKKDKDGKYIDEDKNSTDDKNRAAKESVNLFDIAFSKYSEKLRQERINMNIVEELTRRSIGSELNDSEIRKIAVSMNHEFNDEFRNRVEGLRQYFREKTQKYIDDPKNNISGNSVDNIWGRKRKVNGKNGIEITHDLVANWHTKETLQGALKAIVTEKDLPDLMKKYGMDPKNDVDIKKAEGMFLNKTFLQIRRGEMLEDLQAEIKKEEIQVALVDGSVRDVRIGDLKHSGFLDSVDANAYYTTWMFEWSNYDTIRIYSRDTDSGLSDDFESIVYHQNTNMFWGRHIDHTWEFFHDTNENRGRAKENDVNKIWKQYLPGKHHYLFPQNSIMVRWTDAFMNEDQKADLERRTGEMMSKRDFNNKKYHEEFYGWAKNAVMMDMIENGEVSMSMADNKRKFSEVMKESKVKKFEMIDVFIDRDKHRKYAAPDAFQAYLANPTDDRFVELNDKTKVFYSTRAARQFPFMTLALRAHWDVNSNHRLRLFNVPDLRSAEMENTVNVLEARGDVERKQGEHEKRKLLGFKGVKVGGKMGIPKVADFEAPGALGAFLGTTPLRRLRQTLELGRKSVWEGKHVPLVLPLFFLFGAVWGGFTEFLKQGVRQSSGGQR